MIKLLFVAFAGGVATSFAEHVFNYSLFGYVEAGVKKLISLFSKKAA